MANSNVNLTARFLEITVDRIGHQLGQVCLWNGFGICTLSSVCQEIARWLRRLLVQRNVLATALNHGIRGCVPGIEGQMLTGLEDITHLDIPFARRTATGIARAGLRRRATCAEDGDLGIIRQLIPDSSFGFWNLRPSAGGHHSLTPHRFVCLDERYGRVKVVFIGIDIDINQMGINLPFLCKFSPRGGTKLTIVLCGRRIEQTNVLAIR